MLESWGFPATPFAVISLEPWPAIKSVPRHVVPELASLVDNLSPEVDELRAEVHRLQA